MSEQQLKDLLGEIVDDVPQPGGHRIDTAWNAGRQRRRRSTALVAASAAVVVVAGAAAVVGTRTNDDVPPPADGTPSPSVTEGSDAVPSQRPPAAQYKGAPVWWAPSAADEDGLREYGSVLPPTVDLSPGRPELVPGQAALGVFAAMGSDAEGPLRVLVLSRDGTTSELPAERLQPNRDVDGNGAAVLPANGGLAPDGRHVAFAQQSSIELYDLLDGTWTTIDTADWVAEGTRWLDAETLWVPNGGPFGGFGSTYDTNGGQLLDPKIPRSHPDLDLAAADEPYGVYVDAPGAVAGSYFFAGPVGGGPYTNPEGIVARAGDETSVLAISIQDRFKGCCPVVGWLADDIVAFESDDRVLAWQVGTGTVYRVADLTGVDPGREWLATSWAWQSLR